jgi:perosamine synthetase
MVLTNDDRLADRVHRLKGQGLDPNRRYYFPIVGYNYRMTNIEAAIGLAQVEKIDWHIQRRREVASTYLKRLGSLDGLAMQREMPWAKHVFWMNCIVIGDRYSIDRDEFMVKLADRGIETRPFFYPVHKLPMYSDQFQGDELPVAQALSRRGVNLPSHANLSDDDIHYVCDQIEEVLADG